MRFSKAAVASFELPQGKTDAIWFDDQHPGLGFRIRAGGKKTWVFQYRVNGKTKRMTLGGYPALGIDDARSRWKRESRKDDPQGEKEKARAASAVTLGVVVDRFLAVKEKQLRPSSYRDAKRYLRESWSPLHRRPISDINRADIANRLLEMAEGGALVAADRARTALATLFSWAWGEGIVESNPALATNRPIIAKARERVLSKAELVAVWEACRDDDFGRIVRLLILTGQRREEVSGMVWQELNLEGGLWSMQGERTKNHRPHEVPLPDAALDIIRAVDVRDDRDLLFGEGEGSFSGFSRAKANLESRIEAAWSKAKPMPQWQLHDLRRTCATGMIDLGIAPHVVEAVLNHVSGARAGVAGTYNRSLYIHEKRAALTLWADHVMQAVTGKAPRVVPLKKRA